MGEYAKRTSDGAQVKIGTCESMYYLRFEDRRKVRPMPGSVNPGSDAVAAELRFRVPFPDEDGKQPGDYEDYNRGARLYRTVVGPHGDSWTEDYTDPELANHPGIIQLRHESGLLVNMPCYHGVKLPDAPPGGKVFWNDKTYALDLGMIRAHMQDGALVTSPVIRCRHCGGQWRMAWSDVWDFLPPDLRTACEKYRSDRDAAAAK